MLKYFSLFLLSLTLFSYGVLVGVYGLFPYQEIQVMKNKIFPKEEELFGRNNQERINLFEAFYINSDIAFVGDSITREGEWSDFFPNIKVVNMGVSADKTSDILARADSILLANPRKVFIMAGINDISQNIPSEQTLNNYEIIIDILINADIQVIVQSTIQCALLKCGEETIRKVNLLNLNLLQLSNQKGVKFLHLDDLSNSEGLSSLFSHDGVHLNTKGFIYWVDKISSSL